MDLHDAGEEVGEQFPATAIGHVQDIDTGQQLERFAHEMAHGAHPGRAPAKLAGVALGVGHQLLHRVGRH